ncbi:MAG TPA: hypothetical protein PK583_04725, partial [Gammaproteobacteria bacterium]|nr:hypothetical protein [Gammaproteobacteria bacterium]
LQKAAVQIDAESIEIFINALNPDMGDRLPLMMNVITEKLALISDKIKKTSLEFLFEEKKKTMGEIKEAMGSENPQRSMTHALDLLKKDNKNKQDVEPDLNATTKEKTTTDKSGSGVTLHYTQPDDEPKRP